MQIFIQKFRELPFKNYVYLSLFLPILVIAAVLILRNSLPPEVPIFYGRPVGEAQLTKTLGLAIPPLISIAILGVNLTISVLTSEVFVKKILVVTSFVSSLLAAITVIKVIFLVI